MNPINQLREWADQIEQHGNDLSTWTSTVLLVSQMRELAIEFAKYKAAERRVLAYEQAVAQHLHNCEA